MAGVNRSNLKSSIERIGLKARAKSAARGIRALSSEFALALESTALAEQNHRHPAMAKRLYVNGLDTDERP